MYITKLNNIKIRIYDLTNHEGKYKITFINLKRNIGKNDIFILTDNKKIYRPNNKVCRRLINFKLYSIVLSKINK
jgi:hypothetical protein